MAASRLFTLEGKGLKLTSAEDIEPHIKELRENNDVEEVRFQGNTLGIGASEALAKVLESKKKLQIVNFADIFTSRLLSEIPPAMTALVNAFLTLPKLQTVNLSDNAFGLNTVAPLVTLISAHTPLRHLILNNNGLGPLAGTQVANALTELAKKKDGVAADSANAQDRLKLETIVCGRNRLESGSMAAWAKAIVAHGEDLKELRMVQNGIRHDGINEFLRDGLSKINQLRVLDMQDNTFIATGASRLSRMVGNWTELRELGVGDCLLRARGGIMLGEALAKGQNAKLEVLKLSFNEIGSKGLGRIAEATKVLPRLRRVELNGNCFSEDDESIEVIRAHLLELRKKEGPPLEEDTEEWGMDELDELEDEESEEEEDEEVADDDDEEKAAEKEVKMAEEAENENVAQDKDKSVDKLADMLGKTEI